MLSDPNLSLRKIQGKKLMRSVTPIQVLSASKGNILEDEGAITVVSDAKALGTDIAEKQRAADETRSQIEEARRSGPALHILKFAC